MFGFARSRDVRKLRKDIEQLTVALSRISRIVDDLSADVSRLRQADISRRVGSNSEMVRTPASIGTYIELPGDPDTGFGLGIVGESYRQVALRALAGDRRKRGEEVVFIAVLVPEPTNIHDSNAVSVHVKGGAHIGYLSREDAARYRPVFQFLVGRSAAGLCRAKLIGGTSAKPSIGVMLNLAGPGELLGRIAPNEQPF